MGMIISQIKIGYRNIDLAPFSEFHAPECLYHGRGPLAECETSAHA